MLTDLVRKFEESEEATVNARAEAEKARDYVDGKQLTDTQIKALNRRKQPIVIENLIRPKIDYLCGLERQGRTDPKAYPRTAKHEDDANAATDALRYVCEDQNFAIKRSWVFNNMMVEGVGGVEVIVKQVRNQYDPSVEYIPWDRIFYDPHSSSPDFSDAQYVGFITWMDASTAKRRWPEAKDVIDATIAKPTGSAYDTYEDKPKWTYWADSKRKRVRIVTMYCVGDGGWYRAVFTLAGELEPYAPSPYMDEEGRPDCALILQSANVDRDNDRYGIVRDFITLQDEVNKRRSKFLHLSNTRQYRISRAMQTDEARIKTQMAQPDAVIVADPGEIEIISQGDLAAGHFNLLAEAKAAIQATGPNATMQGKSGQDQSGRAILALQQGGMTEMAPMLDALRHFNVRVYRAIWNRIRQVWTAERWVRVTDDEKNVRFVGMNITKGHAAMSKLADAVKAGQLDEQTAAQYEMQIMSDPTMAEKMNSVAEMDVDINMDEVVDTATLQIEQFEQLTKLAPITPPDKIPLMFEMMVEASGLRNKEKILQLIEKDKQGASQPNPMQEVQMRGAVAEVNKTEAETAKLAAQTRNEQLKPLFEGVKAGVQLPAAAPVGAPEQMPPPQFQGVQ